MTTKTTWLGAATMTALVGCSFDGGSSTAGEDGVFRFTYQSTQCDALRCGLEHPVMVGTRSVLLGEGKHAGPVTVEVEEPELASVEMVDLAYRCERGAQSRAIREDERCGADEETTVQFSVVLEAKAVATPHLVVRDTDGARVDRVGVRQREVTRIVAEVSLVGASDTEAGELREVDGVFEISLGSKLSVEPLAFHQSTRLLFDEGPRYVAEPNTQLREQSPGFVLFPSPAITYLAESLGEVSFVLEHATQRDRFVVRVVP